MRDVSPAYVGFGSFSSDRPASDALGMSASLRSRPNLRTAANRRDVPGGEGADSRAAKPWGSHDGGNASDFVAHCPSKRSRQFPRAAPMHSES